MAIAAPVYSRVSNIRLNFPSILVDFTSTKSGNDEDKWNDAWESAWLPDDLTDKSRAPWETDVNFPSTAAAIEEIDVEAKAFVEDMNEHWNERRGKSGTYEKKERKEIEGESLYSLKTMKKDYKLKKQKVHAFLWVKEIEKLEEAKLGESGSGGAKDIDRLLDSCSELVKLSLSFMRWYSSR